MNLGVSIANLLRRYPAVGVPGIGVFRKSHYPASYDAGKAVFLPPVDRIELVDNDPSVFQIITYIQAQRQLTGYEATAVLEDAVRAIMDTISRQGEALLDGLGYLLADEASFRFKPFEVEGLAAKPIPAQSPIASLPREPVTPSDEVVDDVSAEPETALAITDANPGQRFGMWWVVGGAVAVVLIAAAVVWQYQPAWFGNMSAELTTASDHQEVLPTPSDEATPLVEADQDSVAIDTSLVVAAVDSTLVDSVPVTAPPAKPSVTYEIIVGSFATMQQADKFVAEMKAKGYDLHAIDSRMPGNRKKISWGSFATEEEAYKELARVQKTFEPGAWIAKIAHN